MHTLRSKSWSPYVVGVALGMLSWFAFATAERGLGITTAFEHSSALALDVVGISPPDGYQEKERPTVGWETALVIGVLLGSALSSWLSKDRNTSLIPRKWRERFGDSRSLRAVAAFLGGATMMVGARIAGGCTSGHGITGSLQLAVSSSIFIVLAFAVASVLAITLYGRGARHVRKS